MKDYADQLLMESRNDVNYEKKYTRKMLCPNRWPLGKKEEWNDLERYYCKKKRKPQQCPAGEKEVKMKVREDGMWTTIKCPRCGYGEFWAIGDEDELF